MSQDEAEVVASTLRMPKHLRDELKIQAIREGRSFTSHVVTILRRALEGFEDQNEKDRQGGHPNGLKQS